MKMALPKQLKNLFFKEIIMKYIKTKKLESAKLTKDNFYVLMDFDRTLTKGDSISAWRVLYYSDLLGDDFKPRYDAIHDKHNIKLENRFEEFIKMLHEKKIDNHLIEKAVQKTNLQLREGAKEFLAQMNHMKIPVIIISCSLKNVIQEYLKWNDCDYSNIHICANYCDIEESGKNDIYHVTPCNKNQIAFSKAVNTQIEQRKYAILIGDIVEDINMVTKEKLENTITVGFLNQEMEENLELYQEAFDIVLADNASFEELEEILFEKMKEG